MAETRQIGNTNIQFLGENARSPAAEFDGLYSVSPTFRSTVDEAASRYRCCENFLNAALN